MFIEKKSGKPYPSFPSRSQGFARRCLLPVSNFGPVHAEGPVDQLRLPCEKIFFPPQRSRETVASPRLPPLLSLALRHWRATLIIRYRSVGRIEERWAAGGGRRRGQARGAWNEESGSMLGQHIKIMASIGADAPYIPIRGKGLRLISIASRYPSPGWKARARTHARTHTRVDGKRPTVCSIGIFAFLQRLPVPCFRPLRERKRAAVSSHPILLPSSALTFPPIELFLPLLARRRVIEARYPYDSRSFPSRSRSRACFKRLERFSRCQSPDSLIFFLASTSRI